MALPFLPAIRMEEGLTILGREILAIAAPGLRDFIHIGGERGYLSKRQFRFFDKKSEQIILQKIA